RPYGVSQTPSSGLLVASVMAGSLGRRAAILGGRQEAGPRLLLSIFQVVFVALVVAAVLAGAREGVAVGLQCVHLRVEAGGPRLVGVDHLVALERLRVVLVHLLLDRAIQPRELVLQVYTAAQDVVLLLLQLALQLHCLLA